MLGFSTSEYLRALSNMLIQTKFSDFSESKFRLQIELLVDNDLNRSLSWSTHVNSLYLATEPPVLRLQKTFEHFVPTEIFQYFPSSDNFFGF